MLRMKDVFKLSSCCRSASTMANVDSKDIFGTLSQTGGKLLASHATEKLMPEDPDGYDKEEYDLEPRKNAYYYKYEIRNYAKQGSVGLRKALELFQAMKSKDRLTPTIDNFSPLLSGCAKAGYTQKAFELYKEYLKYENKPTNSMKTSLINACAESPFPEYGLKRLDWFMEHLRIDLSQDLNKIQYRCAIKAYGKLGRLEQASKLVQEMIEKGYNPDTETFNMLLIGCASNKEAGCSLALRVYKRMRLYNLKPDNITYNLLLRCIRDCGLGSPLLLKQTLNELPALTSFDQRLKYKKQSKKKGSPDNDTTSSFEWVPLISDLGGSLSTALNPEVPQSSEKLLEAEKSSRSSNLRESGYITISPTSDQRFDLVSVDNSQPLPNLLSEAHLDLMYRVEAIQFDKVKNASDRILLFGGMHGFLSAMSADGCPPDTKTFSLLLGCIKRKKHDQLEYYRLAKDYSIKRDLLFYDLLIRHVCETHKDKTRLQQAFYLIEEMHKDSLRPNISTFESLALGCDTKKGAEKFIEDIGRVGFKVSDVMIRRFFDSAIHNTDFKYLNWLIGVSKECDYRPTKQLVDILEEKRIVAHDIILKYEKGKLTDSKPFWLNDSQIKNFDIFCTKLGNWLKEVDLMPEIHPWKQFHVKQSSKRSGFVEFVKELNAINHVKQKALEKGEVFGNLTEKAKRIREQQEVKR